VTFDLILHLVSRFVHIASVILLLGGTVYARQVLVPTLNTLPEDIRSAAATRSQSRFRTTLYVLLFLIVASGLYNFLSYSGPEHSQAYHIWFGIKVLLVAHLVSASILWAISPYGDVAVGGSAKRRLLSIGISGMLIVLISAYLRSLSQRGL
jgi:uncharacterized membrane protein